MIWSKLCGLFPRSLEHIATIRLNILSVDEQVFFSELLRSNYPIQV